MSTEAFLFPVDYTSRDYTSLREDLINVIQSRIPEWQADDPTDFGVALVEAFAYMGDVLNYYIDRAAAETFLGTASQRQSLLNIASLLGYAPSGRVAAQVPLTFTNNGSSIATIAAGSKLTTVIKTGDSNLPLTFEVLANSMSGDGSWSVSPGGLSTVIPVVEGVTVTDKVIGSSTGYPGQSFPVRDYPLINRSLSIKVGASAGTAVAYTYVQNLYDATPSDKVFTYRTDDQGVTTVQFGDGVSGLIPPIGQNVYATYRLGGGVIGNISHGASFAPNGFAFTGAITNQIQATGGADEESNDHIRASAFAAFRTRNSAVTKQDFQDLALTDNRLAKAKARGNSYGNMLVYVAPVSSGDRRTDPEPGYDAYNVVTRALTSNVATLTLAETPQFAVSAVVGISGMGAPWDGSVTITGISGNNITFALTHADIPSAPTSGILTTGELADFAAVRADVQKSLQSKGVVGTIVNVYPPRYRDIQVAVEIGILPQFRQTTAVSSVKAAMAALFNYTNVDFNQSIRPQEILAYLVNSVEEIQYATVTLYDGVGGSTSTLIQSASDQILRLLDTNLSVTIDPAVPGINA